MSNYEDQSETPDTNIASYQLSLQKELLAQIDKIIEVLDDRIHIVLADERSEKGDEVVIKSEEAQTELVLDLAMNNNRLSGYALRLNSIIDRVRL